MAEKNPVAVPSKYWESQVKTWNLVDTLTGGTEAMRLAAKAYLPQEPKEPQAAYKNRVERSVLTPLYEDTLRKMVGKIMKQPVVTDEAMPETLTRYADDIDAEGTDLNDWTARIAYNGLNHGITFILVDMPSFRTVRENTGREPTRLDVNRGILRPYAINITADQIIGFKTDMVDGQKVLIQLRFRMITMEDSPEDEFSEEEKERIHVWEIGRRRVYEKRKDNEGAEDWVLIEDDNVDLAKIPLIPVYGEYVDFMKGEPPMLDIAHLNIAHWQSDSDQRNILHVARVPLLFGSGLGEGEDDFNLEVGPNTMTKGPQGSDLKYVEHSGTGIEAGNTDLDTLERRIAKLGLNMVLKRQTGDVTATARALDQSEADSPLAMFARHLEKQLEAMFDLFAEMLRLPESNTGITVYKDFSITMRDAEDIKSLGEMRARGDISQATYWHELQRRNLLSDDFDPEEEVDLLDLEFDKSMERSEDLMGGDQNGEDEEDEIEEGQVPQDG